MKVLKKTFVALALSTLCYGCGHTNVSKIGLLSVGDLESRIIPTTIEGPVLTGKDECGTGGTSYYLSEAVRNALLGTEYDTIVDAEITTNTGLFVWSNNIEVKGKAIKSTELPKQGGAE